MSTPSLRNELKTIVVCALLALFLLPGLTYLFTHHAQTVTDTEYLIGINEGVDGDGSLSAAEKVSEKAFFAANLASSACESTDPELSQYKANVCAPYSDMWQFVWVEKISLWTLIFSFLLLLVMAGLGALAFANRTAQYLSFVIGWRTLIGASALLIVVQGGFATWLSYWLTAWYAHVYVVKLILIVAVAAAMAVFAALMAIFKCQANDNVVQGELISVEQAPALWARIREFAAKLGTPAPTQIVAGIDTNFFVTQTPLTINATGDMDAPGYVKTSGRALFVSIPLLRILDQHEAEAVLAHELGHFVGGDTANSAALGPKINQYDHYMQQMHDGGVTLPAFWLLRLYRVIFEFALQKSTREREFIADSTAAKLTSPQGIVHSLVKISAYASYRAEVENKLFEQNEQHTGALDVGHRVASGLAAFSQSAAFNQAMQASNVPHPFDSHPPLLERMRNVGYVLDAVQFPAVAACAPAASWADAIVGGGAIEARLWQAFEARFAKAHEQTLAYRYEPSNDVERELVLRYFPPIAFALKKNQVFEVNYAGLKLPQAAETLSWDSVKNLIYDDATLGSDVLKIEHPEKGWIGQKTTKVPLSIARKERDRVKETMAKYWQRHQIMRAKG
jgi:Zn-dependent protease with chaperone function